MASLHHDLFHATLAGRHSRPVRYRAVAVAFAGWDQDDGDFFRQHVRTSVKISAAFKGVGGFGIPTP